MSLKYVLNSMRKRKLRTAIVAIALIIGVALVGALLALVDTQRQFSTQTIGAQTGGFDLNVAKSDLAESPFFDIETVAQTTARTGAGASAIYPRIQASVEGRKVGALEGQALTVVALDTATDTLVKPPSAAQSSGGFQIRFGGGGQGGGNRGPGGGNRGPGGRGGGPPVRAGFGGRPSVFDREAAGSYPPADGQIFLTSATAGILDAQVGDEVTLSYAVPLKRDKGKTAVTGTSTPRLQATFLVAGIGTLNGFASDVSNPVVVNLADAQRWLGATGQANQMLLLWQSETSNSTDARAIVSRARNNGEALRDTLQERLGPDFSVSLPKYATLEATSQVFALSQTFITVYGLLSMGIVGLMVNALMNTTVAEQKYELAIIRVLGAPRHNLYNIVITEVFVLGVIGVVFGLLLGRAINDYVISPLLAANLDLPSSVNASWSLQTVLIPTGITALVLTLATISPARTAAATKVMVVLNPAAADQPTLEDIAKLRERRAESGLLITGVVLLIFSSVVLIVLPTIFGSGNISGQVTVIFGSLLLMVIGISLVFYFITTPLERVLVWLYERIYPKAGYFAGRYALRGKGRNALISLMVVMSGVLPTLLATQLALQDANVETDTRFNNGAQLVAARAIQRGGFQFFRRDVQTDINLTEDDVKAVTEQPGVDRVVGIADNLPNMTAGDRISLRTSNVSLVGVDGDLTTVLYPALFRWTNGDARALQRIATDRDAVVISEGLSQALDLTTGDTIKVTGNGSDHFQELEIAGVAARIPGFNNQITRNASDAGRSAILMHLETYRALQDDPADGPPDADARIVTKLFATVDGDFDESTVLSELRVFLGQKAVMNVNSAAEQVEQTRTALDQGRVFIILLTGLSMVTAIFGVLAVMYTAVMSRRVEIGMLKAVGASKGALRGVFMGEAIITTLAAGIAGIIAGTILGYAFEASQRLQNDRPILLAFDFGTAALIVALVSFAALLSAALATQPVIRRKAIHILRER